jgi:hypothetical protein
MPTRMTQADIPIKLQPARRADRTLTTAALLLGIIFAALSAQAQSTPDQLVWYWSGNCASGKRIETDISLHGKTIYKFRFRACRMRRGDENPQGNRVFYFAGGHNFQGTYKTTSNERIEGTIWQAGADPDDLILGIAFATKKQILLNTLDIVKPGKATQFELDSGLWVRNFPVPAGGSRGMNHRKNAAGPNN